MPRLHVVFGNYQGPLDVKPGEKAVFIGDCATFHGKIGDELVSIENLYKSRSTLDPHKAEGEDIVVKTFKTMGILRAAKDKSYLRLKGCPVSVSEQLITLAQMSEASDPTRDFAGAFAYVKWKSVMAAKALVGHKYQVPGPTQRGEAAPEVEPQQAPAE